MADITCPVCHSANAPTRTFCWKCAADLHAPVADPSAPPPEPKVIVPIQPILIGIGVAVAAIALIALVVVLLGGSPAATTSPSGEASAAPTSVASNGCACTTLAPSAPPVTDAPATDAPPTEAPAATPKVTQVPAPRITSFKGPESVDCSDPSYDGFITLTWTIEDADSADLSIDGSGLYQNYAGGQRSERLPFSCGNGQHTYTLTTVGGEGRAASKTLTIIENSGV